jgi:hypothetical protein
MDSEDAEIDAMLQAEAEYMALLAGPEEEVGPPPRPVATPARAASSGVGQGERQGAPDSVTGEGRIVQLPVALGDERGSPACVAVAPAEAPKRRRIIGKQRDVAAVVPPVDTEEDAEQEFSKDEKNRLLLAVRGVWVHLKIVEGKETCDNAESWKKLRSTWQKIWSAMSAEARLEAGRSLERQGHLEAFPGAIRALEYVAASEKPKGPAQPRGSNRISCQAFLMTFNGPWGVVSDPVVLQHKGDLPAVEKAVRECQQFRDLVTSAIEFGKSMQAKFGATHLSMTLELCTRTFTQAGTVRVHLHVTVSKSNGRMHMWQPESWMFMGSPPADFQHPSGRGGN